MRILFSCGGTAGHINPAIAIAKYIKSKEPKWDILFIGAKGGMESRLVPEEGFNIEYINVKGLKRKLSFDTIKTIVELGRGLVQSRKIIKRFKPDYVIGTGGYVCGPVLFNASIMKIPALIHEQNVFPGITVRILSRLVNIVAISFEESRQYLKKSKSIILTGNPIRKEIICTEYNSARKKLGLDKKPFILCFGGSLGAEKLNEAFLEYIIKIHKEKKENSIQVLIGTGERYFEDIKKKLIKYGLDINKQENIKIVPYVYDMANAMAASDIVVSRAGAITVSEITACGKPAILIPSPNVTNNHQEYNAGALKKKGAAIVINENNLSGEVLYEKIEYLLNNKNVLEKMARNSLNLGKIDASKNIFDIIHKQNKAV